RDRGRGHHPERVVPLQPLSTGRRVGAEASVHGPGDLVVRVILRWILEPVRADRGMEAVVLVYCRSHRGARRWAHAGGTVRSGRDRDAVSRQLLARPATHELRPVLRRRAEFLNEYPATMDVQPAWRPVCRLQP